jgi:hypothetical protein
VIADEYTQGAMEKMEMDGPKVGWMEEVARDDLQPELLKGHTSLGHVTDGPYGACISRHLDSTWNQVALSLAMPKDLRFHQERQLLFDIPFYEPGFWIFLKID